MGVRVSMPTFGKIGTAIPGSVRSVHRRNENAQGYSWNLPKASLGTSVFYIIYIMRTFYGHAPGFSFPSAAEASDRHALIHRLLEGRHPLDDALTNDDAAVATLVDAKRSRWRSVFCAVS